MTLKCEACEGSRIAILPSNDGDLGSVEKYPCPCCVVWPDGFGGLSYLNDNGKRVVIMTAAPAGQLSTYLQPSLLPKGVLKRMIDNHLIPMMFDEPQRPQITNKPTEEKTNG